MILTLKTQIHILLTLTIILFQMTSTMAIATVSIETEPHYLMKPSTTFLTYQLSRKKKREAVPMDQELVFRPQLSDSELVELYGRAPYHSLEEAKRLHRQNINPKHVY